MADLSMLRAETHKFESHYIDNLVGKLHKHISFIQYFYAPFISSSGVAILFWLQVLKRITLRGLLSILLIGFLAPSFYSKDWKTRYRYHIFFCVLWVIRMIIKGINKLQARNQRHVAKMLGMRVNDRIHHAILLL